MKSQNLCIVDERPLDGKQVFIYTAYDPAEDLTQMCGKLESLLGASNLSLGRAYAALCRRYPAGAAG